MLVSGGHRPKDILEWTDTELALAASTALKFEAWKIEQLSKIFGGSKKGRK